MDTSTVEVFEGFSYTCIIYMCVGQIENSRGATLNLEKVLESFSSGKRRGRMTWYFAKCIASIMPLPSLPGHVSDFPFVCKITHPSQQQQCGQGVLKSKPPQSPKYSSEVTFSTIACSAVQCWPPLPHHRHRHHSPVPTFHRVLLNLHFSSHDPHQECAG